MFNCIYCNAELKFLNKVSKIFDEYLCENHYKEVHFAFKKNELYDISISLDDYEILICLDKKTYNIYMKNDDDGEFYFVDECSYKELPTPENIELFLLFK